MLVCLVYCVSASMFRCLVRSELHQLGVQPRGHRTLHGRGSSCGFSTLETWNLDPIGGREFGPSFGRVGSPPKIEDT